jgi:hypothetical protein
LSKQTIKARNKARAAKKATRVQTALSMIEAGTTINATAVELGINRRTLQRNLRQIRERVETANVEKYEVLREKHHEELATMVEFVLESSTMSDSEVAAHFRMYKADIARLLGINRERTTTNVAVAVGAGLSYEFLRHSHGLDDSQLTAVYAYMDALPKATPAVDESYFPSEPKQIESAKVADSRGEGE